MRFIIQYNIDFKNFVVDNKKNKKPNKLKRVIDYEDQTTVYS